VLVTLYQDSQEVSDSNFDKRLKYKLTKEMNQPFNNAHFTDGTADAYLSAIQGYCTPLSINVFDLRLGTDFNIIDRTN